MPPMLQEQNQGRPFNLAGTDCSTLTVEAARLLTLFFARDEASLLLSHTPTSDPSCIDEAPMVYDVSPKSILLSLIHF